jgi:hypothetical protein
VTWSAFVASWIVNDYRAMRKRGGSIDPDLARAVLTLWWTGVIPSTLARTALRESFR